MRPWIEEHWEGLTFRRERRAVRTREKLARYFLSFAEWAERVPTAGWLTTTDREQAYREAWYSADAVWGLGRYGKLKLLEALNRGGYRLELPDIRARGGWSPRQALALLIPEHADVLGRDTKSAAVEVEKIAEDYRLTSPTLLNRYEFQVLLCDYKQSYVGRRQYPGRSQDSEIAYSQKIADYWPWDTAMWGARAGLFPPEVLGEIAGWDHVRDELGHVLTDHGYTWSDFRYDYLATTDLASPVTR